MDNQRIQKLINYQNEIGIKFSNIDLFNQALTHKSYANEVGRTLENNEKLELLGDSVLNFIVVEYLYRQFTDYTEGELSKIKSVVVSEVSLADIARDIGLGENILLGKGEKVSGGAERAAILADTTEALIGAYYLDSGMERIKFFILPYLAMVIFRYQHNKEFVDFKTDLQLYSQQRFKLCPTYKTIKEDGPDHSKVFYINVAIGNKNYGVGKGHNKKAAQQDAARLALEQLKQS